MSPELLTIFLLYMVADGNRRGIRHLLLDFWEQAEDFSLELPQDKPVSASAICQARERLDSTVFRDLLYALSHEDSSDCTRHYDAERDLRHLAVGRNNWLIFGSQRGGEVACRLYSLMLSCKQCGANPEAHLEDVLMKVAVTPASEIATLTPWAWQAGRSGTE